MGALEALVGHAEAAPLEVGAGLPALIEVLRQSAAVASKGKAVGSGGRGEGSEVAALTLEVTVGVHFFYLVN